VTTQYPTCSGYLSTDVTDKNHKLFSKSISRIWFCQTEQWIVNTVFQESKPW